MSTRFEASIHEYNQMVKIGALVPSIIVPCMESSKWQSRKPQRTHINDYYTLRGMRECINVCFLFI